MSSQSGSGDNGKEPAINGSEFDATTGWKKFYCYLARSGVSKNIKKAMRKRNRAKAKQELKRLIDE